LLYKSTRRLRQRDEYSFIEKIVHALRFLRTAKNWLKLIDKETRISYISRHYQIFMAKQVSDDQDPPTIIKGDTDGPNTIKK